jgi:hypothetical protein
MVAYNLVVRNGNSSQCSVTTNVLVDGAAFRQSVIATPMGGVYSGGQTIAMNPTFVGSHIVNIQAYASCANMDVDITNWIGGTYGSTMTTWIVKH